MCVEPTTAMMIGSALSSGLQYKQQKQAQKNQYNAQIRQNDIAKRNAIQRYASEQLKINQQVKATQQKGYEANLKSKKAACKLSNLAFVPQSFISPFLSLP